MNPDLYASVFGEGTPATSIVDVIMNYGELLSPGAISPATD